MKFLHFEKIDHVKWLFLSCKGSAKAGQKAGFRDTYGLLTKCEVKMTGYWPNSFFACLWTETKSRSINSQKKNEANIEPS